MTEIIEVWNELQSYLGESLQLYAKDFDELQYLGEEDWLEICNTCKMSRGRMRQLQNKISSIINFTANIKNINLSDTPVLTFDFKDIITLDYTNKRVVDSRYYNYIHDKHGIISSDDLKTKLRGYVQNNKRYCLALCNNILSDISPFVEIIKNYPQIVLLDLTQCRFGSMDDDLWEGLLTIASYMMDREGAVVIIDNPASSIVEKEYIEANSFVEEFDRIIWVESSKLDKFGWKRWLRSLECIETVYKTHKTFFEELSK